MSGRQQREVPTEALVFMIHAYFHTQMSATAILDRAKELCRENGGGNALHGHNPKKLQGIARSCMRQLYLKPPGATANPTKQWGQKMEAHGANFILWALANSGKEYSEWAGICDRACVREVDAGLRNIGNMNMPPIIQHAGSHHNSVYDFDSSGWLKTFKLYQKATRWAQGVQGLPMEVTSQSLMHVLSPGPLLLRYIRDLQHRDSGLGHSSRGTTVVASEGKLLLMW